MLETRRHHIDPGDKGVLARESDLFSRTDGGRVRRWGQDLHMKSLRTYSSPRSD